MKRCELLFVLRAESGLQYRAAAERIGVQYTHLFNAANYDRRMSDLTYRRALRVLIDGVCERWATPRPHGTVRSILGLEAAAQDVLVEVAIAKARLTAGDAARALAAAQ